MCVSIPTAIDSVTYDTHSTVKYGVSHQTHHSIHNTVEYGVWCVTSNSRGVIIVQYNILCHTKHSKGAVEVYSIVLHKTVL